MKSVIRKLIRTGHIARVKLIRSVSKRYRETHGATGEEKWETLDEIRKTGGYRVLVETGTYLGDTVEHFRDSFKDIYSIELGKELAAAARARFTSFPHIKIIEGDSTEVLPRLLEEINEPAIFWLDAHCSEGNTVRGNDYSPILSELSSILSNPIRHVIVIDDARLFDGINYPTLGTIKKLVRSLRPQAVPEVRGDLIRIRT